MSDEITDVAALSFEDALAERGCCGVRLRSADEWRQHPQGVALGKVPPIEIFKIGDAPPEPSLSGVLTGRGAMRYTPDRHRSVWLPRESRVEASRADRQARVEAPGARSRIRPPSPHTFSHFADALKCRSANSRNAFPSAGTAV